MIATGTEERPPTRCSLRTMGPTAGSSTLLLLQVAQTLEAKKKLPCRLELIILPCPWLLSLSIQQDQSPGWTDHRLRGVMSLGNQMQFTLFNADLFSKSAISQFLLGNILQTRQICLFMDCVQMDQETDFAQCSDPRRRPERRGEDDVIRRRSDDEEAAKVVDSAPLKNIKEVTFFPRGGGIKW